MKQISILLVLLLSSSFCLAQFGLMENKYLASLKSDEELSLIIKADATQVKNACALLGANFKYSYQNLSAISIKKQDLQNLYELLENSQMEIPLAQAQTLMDTALIHNHVIEVHSGMSPLLQAYTGKDVVVGILDSGIYFEHEDFKNADGSSRIKFIWDQNVSNPSISPAPYNYGQEWSWIDIDNGACNHVEPANQFGHGTTVAGAACGNGLATGQYKGVAPDCDIIVVAVDYYGNDFLSKSVDAIDYVFKKADALGKPCVINTSFGSYSGSHDGRDFASLIIDALLEERPGRALVASAGNGNNINNTEANFTPTHLSYTLSSDTNFTWFKTISSFSQCYFDLWADTADFNQAYFSVGNDKASSYLPGGYTNFLNVSNFVGDLSQGVYLSQIVYDANSAAQGQVEMFLEEAEGRYHLEVLVSPNNNQDLWRFSTTGSGRFDIWSSFNFHGTSNMVYSNLPPNFIVSDIANYKLPDNEKCIVSGWQCSDKVITVGNFANQRYYFDVDSIERDLGLTPGEIYYKSSEGPSRDNRIKPDISSTGNIVFASGNASFISSALNSNRPKVAPGGKHNYNGGTSMSSPIVAGVVALYLEKNPNAWWYEIKEALLQSAIRDSFTGPNANNRYGYGKLNAFELLQFDAILGCTDSNSYNYNPFANVDDGSCVDFVFGCTDSTAFNYNPLANTDDGTCIAIIEGCMDSLALNYNALANVDDGSCTYLVDTTGVSESTAYPFSIHPNPSKGKLKLTCDFSLQNEAYSILLSDLLGNEIETYELSEKISTLYLPDLSAGVYLLYLKGNSNYLGVKKIILE